MNHYTVIIAEEIYQDIEAKGNPEAIREAAERFKKKYALSNCTNQSVFEFGRAAQWPEPMVPTSMALEYLRGYR